MVYINIVMGLGVVLVAAAAAIYFSRPNYQQTPPHHHRRNNRDEDDGEFDNGRSLHGHFTQQRTRRSKPGDKCSVCLDMMNQGHMHEMKCGHALHKDCFEEYRYLRRNCPLCSQTVNLSLPGDDCSICLDPLKRSDMVHLRCQHAMHQICHVQFIDSGAKVCPLCRKEL